MMGERRLRGRRQVDPDVQRQTCKIWRGREREKGGVRGQVSPLKFLLNLLKDFCLIEGEGETLFSSRPGGLGSVGDSPVF